MRKPSFKHFHKFKERYDKIQRKHNLNQPLIPYFISSHPGTEEADMANLAIETKEMGFKLEQVNDFTPTPMTVATVIYYSGVHPYTLKPTFVPKSAESKADQHRFFFWHKPENKQWINDKLKSVGRPDLAEKLVGKVSERGQKEVPKWLAEKRKKSSQNSRTGRKRK